MRAVVGAVDPDAGGFGVGEDRPVDGRDARRCHYQAIADRIADGVGAALDGEWCQLGHGGADVGCDYCHRGATVQEPESLAGGHGTPAHHQAGAPFHIERDGVVGRHRPRFHRTDRSTDRTQFCRSGGPTMPAATVAMVMSSMRTKLPVIRSTL